MKQDDYEDIIEYQPHKSMNHPRMSIENRAAQFAPFSALTGYKEAVIETSRLTEEKIDIFDEIKEIINNKIQFINEYIHLQPEITFTYFVHDEKKKGGKYISVTKKVKKVDMINQCIILTDKTKISINEIINIEGNLFKNVFGDDFF